MSLFRPLLVVSAALMVLTGVVYPLAMTATGRLCFPRQVAGSLLRQDGQLLGSRLIGQHTENPGYFWGRLSATDLPSNAANSAGSNLATSNPALKDKAAARIQALRAADPGNLAPVPVELVTASGSGLDPHISPAAAEYQVQRIARVRGRSAAEIRARVAAATTGRLIGLFGEPTVNVLELNLSLGQAKP